MPGFGPPRSPAFSGACPLRSRLPKAGLLPRCHRRPASPKNAAVTTNARIATAVRGSKKPGILMLRVTTAFAAAGRSTRTPPRPPAPNAGLWAAAKPGFFRCVPAAKPDAKSRASPALPPPAGVPQERRGHHESRESPRRSVVRKKPGILMLRVTTALAAAWRSTRTPPRPPAPNAGL